MKGDEEKEAETIIYWFGLTPSQEICETFLRSLGQGVSSRIHFLKGGLCDPISGPQTMVKMGS